jgi:hypothetical protein
MPRRSAAELEMIETALDVPRLAPPEYLDEAQRRHWEAITAQYPPSHFGSDSAPLLVELVTHMALSRRVNAELDAMRDMRLNSVSAKGARVREAFLELAKMAQHEARVIMALSTKLRLTHSSRRNDPGRVDERALTVLPNQKKPWEQ